MTSTLDYAQFWRKLIEDTEWTPEYRYERHKAAQEELMAAHAATESAERAKLEARQQRRFLGSWAQPDRDKIEERTDPDRARCSGRTKHGYGCAQSPLNGSDKCFWHGGQKREPKPPQHKPKPIDRADAKRSIGSRIRREELRISEAECAPRSSLGCDGYSPPWCWSWASVTPFSEMKYIPGAYFGPHR